MNQNEIEDQPKAGSDDALRTRILDLEAENARLQERVEAFERQDKAVGCCAGRVEGWKKLAERRKGELDWDRWLIAMLVATEYTQHAEGCPRERDQECECWMAQVFTAAEARATIEGKV